MNRRAFLLTALALPVVRPALAGETPWTARIVDGGFDGAHYWAGFAIEMAPGWKTYWRVPGEGGIPPDVQAAGDNLKSVELLFPTPGRFRDEAGETIGYKDKVVFPLKLAPKDVSQPLAVTLSAFFGVCEVVCIPAKADGALRFSIGSQSTPDTVLVQQWLARVPKPGAEGPVLSARAFTEGSKTLLELTLAGQVDDLFVRAGERHYVHAPSFSGSTALCVVAGAKSADELKGLELLVVSVKAGTGLEQRVRVN